MFESVLIANRGEIACRIARTARRLGMRTVAVYSEADAASPHVRLCDEAFPIGPAPATQSYLRIDRLIDAAGKGRVQCVHPGYGFLSENAAFAEACAAAGLVFVGPPPEAMRAMGLKDRAKALMEKAGVAVVPGYHGERQEPGFLKEKAYEIGYPVLIKAVAGGGGKGLRRVDRHAEFDAALESARREAESAFGDPRVLIEKWIAAPRHIEFQIFADRHGRSIHLGERDCSLQRRHQKVIEEAPAPGMTPALRDEIGAAAVRAALAVGYVGAGTIEFIADAASGLRSSGFWFMEMNTRLQVEHPVTEAVTGLDLVEWQFRIASGEPLPLRQEEVRLVGHAIEARLYAEDPSRGFLPSPGRLLALRFPEGEGLRVDTGVEQGGSVPPDYDPMIAKIVAHAPTRDAAVQRLAAALDNTVVAGPASNLSFLAALCRTPAFRAGAVDTGFIDRERAALVPAGIDAPAIACGVARLVSRERERSMSQTGDMDRPASPWDAGDGFQLSGVRRIETRVVADGEPVTAVLSWGGDGLAVTVEGESVADDAVAFEAGDTMHVVRLGRQTIVRAPDPDSASSDGAGDGAVRAPMHGKVLAVLVSKGDRVTKGQRLVIVEAMKMEHALVAAGDGIVETISVEAGRQVADGAVLMTVTAGSEGADSP